jgi:DNA-binding PadR family transcriptional regulator
LSAIDTMTWPSDLRPGLRAKYYQLTAAGRRQLAVETFI